jgi:hypothetical protein
MTGCNYVLQCLLYTVYSPQNTVYCIQETVYNVLCAFSYIQWTVCTIHKNSGAYNSPYTAYTVHTYLCLELYCKQCMFCILFTLFNWFLGVMHTVRFVTVYWIQFTAYIMYNTVYNILQYSYCIHPCQTRRHYSAASIVLPTDGTAL